MPNRKPDPERYCEICGAKMSRRRLPSGLLETLNQFNARHTCSAECKSRRGRVFDKRHADPNVVGLRTLVARTCAVCHDLRPASSFDANVKGFRDSTCRACRAALHRSARPDASRDREYLRTKDWQAGAQADTASTAGRNGQPWTGPELELVATRDDLTIAELAAMLGRTYFATKTARQRIAADPRFASLAGRGVYERRA